MSRKIVITGLGAVTGLGVGVSALWDGLCAGRSAIGPIARFDPSGYRWKLGAEVKDFSAKDYVPKSYRKAVKVMVRDTELAVAAAKLAADDAGLVTRAQAGDGATGPALTYPAERLGCHIGAGLICSETQEISAAMVTARPADAAADVMAKTNGLTLKAWGTVRPEGHGGMENLQPLWMLKYLPNMLACHVTIIHGAEGPSNTITCAEASGLLSIGESCRVIERGAADVCFSGGAESKLSLMGVVRQGLAGRLAETGTAADNSVVRPYDSGAGGTVPGEAGGLLILEEQESACRRGARAYAEVAGFGAAHSPPPSIPPLAHGAEPKSNEGLTLAILAALEDAGITPDDVDAIIPQASGVPGLDQPEAGSLREVFASRLSKIPVVTLSPFVGDCAAGNAGILAAAGALCIRDQMLPARVHPGGYPPDLDVGPARARPARLNTLLVCTSSMGGQNAAAVLRQIP
jgi:3-oxoacyl-[acyl-carrier-protein] synthase II